MAKKAGVPVFTIAYGTPDGVVDITLPETGETARIPVPVDGQALADLANGTGGKSFPPRARPTSSRCTSSSAAAIGYDTEHTTSPGVTCVAAMATLGLAGWSRTVVPTTALTGILARR